MPKTFVSITMSLDGFIAGAEISKEQPMGKDGEQLHDWMFTAKTDADVHIIDDLLQSTGAVIVGNGTYSIAIHNDIAWGEVSPYKVPALVLCTEKPKRTVDGFSYHTDGIYDALQKAKATAGEKDVLVMGGANTAQQFISAGLADELHIHIAPILLMQGTRLFEQSGHPPISLKKLSSVDTPAATHLVYEIIK